MGEHDGARCQRSTSVARCLLCLCADAAARGAGPGAYVRGRGGGRQRGRALAGGAGPREQGGRAVIGYKGAGVDQASLLSSADSDSDSDWRGLPLTRARVSYSAFPSRRDCLIVLIPRPKPIILRSRV